MNNKPQPESPTLTVRRTLEGDWQVLREVRLASLADAPDAFAATYDEEATFTDAQWQARARRTGPGDTAVGFFAYLDGRPCGMAVGVLQSGPPSVVELSAVWVAEQARGRGAGRALVEAIEAWARQRGATGLTLEVTETSTGARTLYERLDYREVSSAAATACGARRSPARRMEKAL